MFSEVYASRRLEIAYSELYSEHCSQSHRFSELQLRLNVLMNHKIYLQKYGQEIARICKVIDYL